MASEIGIVIEGEEDITTKIYLGKPKVKRREKREGAKDV